MPNRPPPRPSTIARLAIAFRALWVFGLVRARLRSADLPEVVASLGRVDHLRPPRARPRRLGSIVGRTLAFGPFRARCLHSCLVLFRLLREQGERPELVIGLESNPRDKDAHAWIEVDGRDVGPPPGRRGHAELVRFGGSTAHVTDVLLACLREAPSARAEVRSIVASGRAEAFLQAARRHGVESIVWPLLLETDALDPDQRLVVQRRAAMHGAHQLRIFEDLAWLDDRLREAGVPWLAFKGPVLAALLYRPPSLRWYGDLDVWIPRADFPRAVAALEAGGATVLDANWPLIRREGRGQLHVRLPMGTLADTHWHLLNRRIVRRSFAVPMDDLLSRARTVEVEGRAVATLDPADTLLHLALHAALSGADRLGWLEDVRRSIEVDGPPWDEVVGRARAWKAGPPVAVTLRRARDLLDAAVPDDVLRRLDASSLRRSVGGFLDRRWPVSEPHHRRGIVALWPQLVRDGGRPMATAVARRVAQPIAARLRRLAGAPPPPDPEGGAVFIPSGDLDERERYLTAVADGTL